jgi:hypothetical protein
MTTSTKVTIKSRVADARKQALLEARASVRADILLDPDMTAPQMLERITRTIDALIDKT